MADNIFSLLPLYPDTDTKLNLATERPQSQFNSLKVQSWRRLFENKNVVQVEGCEGSSYQCTPLDAFSCIEVRISYKLQGKLVNSKLVSKPVQIRNQLREILLYDPEPIKARVLLDNFQAYLILSLANRNLRFVSDTSKCDIIINQSTVEADPNPAVVRVNFHSQKNQFMQFFAHATKVSAKYNSSHCVIVFPSKTVKDIFCSQISSLFRQAKVPSQSNIKIIETSPRVAGKNSFIQDPHYSSNTNNLKNDHSASSLVSIHKSKHSQHKDRKKVKISERLNLKKSTTNTKLNTSKHDTSSRQCLNIFEDDELAGENGKSTENVLNDMSMDLRGSFEEFEQTGTSKQEEQMHSDNSFRQKKANWLNPIDQENKKLREENQRLKKQLQQASSIQKELNIIRKKYAAVIEENNRLENQRRAIITDKVKFQSMYHKEYQQKQSLRKELEYLRNPTSPQNVMRRT